MLFNLNIKYCLFLSFLFIGINTSVAQIQGKSQKTELPDSYKERPKALDTPQKRANETMEKLTKTLKLKESQIAPLKKAMLSFETEKHQIEKSSIANSEKFTKLQALNQKKHKDLQRLLDKEQYKTYQLTFP